MGYCDQHWLGPSSYESLHGIKVNVTPNRLRHNLQQGTGCSHVSLHGVKVNVPAHRFWHHLQQTALCLGPPAATLKFSSPLLASITAPVRLASWR